MKRCAMVGLMLLAACQTPAATLADIDRGYDATLDDGDAIDARFRAEMRRLLVGRDVADALAQLRTAGYDCATGEAHENHPDPVSVCTRSFATRACQLDWSVDLGAEGAVVRKVATGFARDCVGLDRDWPDKKRSPIDDQLAPAQ